MSETLRVDRWLWFARFFKSRSLAAKASTDRRIRVNGTVITKSNHQIRPGDVLTFPRGRDIRVIKILALGSRRGPAAEATTLYEDLSEDLEPARKQETGRMGHALRDSGAGRPTKAERRDIMRFVGKG